MSTFSFLRAAEHKDDALASMIEEDGEDDVDDVDNEHQEELYEVDDQVQEYRPAIYRHRPIPLASPSHVDEYEDEYEDYVLSNPHLRKSEDAPRTPTRSRVSEARDSYELEDAPRTLTRAGSQLVSPTRTALPSSNPPTLRRTIAAFSPPPRFQGLRSDDSGGYGDHGSHVLEHERGLFEAPNNPMWRPQDSTSEDWTIPRRHIAEPCWSTARSPNCSQSRGLENVRFSPYTGHHVPGLSRSPSWSGSPVSLNSSASQRSFRDSIRNPDQGTEFDMYLKSGRGFVPSSEVCRKAKFFHLANIPFRIRPRASKPSAVHQHFFDQGKPGDVPSNFCVDVDNPNEFMPATLMFCRFKDHSGKTCNYALKVKNSTTQRIRHIRNTHFDMLIELMNFREAQGEDNGMDVLEILCSRKRGSRTELETPTRRLKSAPLRGQENKTTPTTVTILQD